MWHKGPVCHTVSNGAFARETAAMPDMGDRGRLSGMACEIVSGIARGAFARPSCRRDRARLRIERAMP
jgi:hypothetical protein